MISVIIRTYNEERLLGTLLDAVQGQECPHEVEIILVDSGSQDQTLSIARRHGARIVEIEKHQFTFGRACNIGCRAARGTWAVFVSGHCIPQSKFWLNNLITPLSDPGTAVTYGRQLAAPETRFSEAQVFGKYFPESSSNPPFPFFCNNANAAIRLECWERFRYDETLTGLEDIAFAQRCFESGYKVQYVPNAAVFHIHQETWKQVFSRYEREAFALKEILPGMRLSYLEALGYGLAAVVSDCRKCGLEALNPTRIGSIILYRACQFLGGAHGFQKREHLSFADKLKYYYPV